MAPKTWDDALDVILAELRQTMANRHRKYGPNNIARHGELGIIVRISDKTERLNNMVDNGLGDFDDDSVEDAYRDLANYAIIGLMVRRGLWKLPVRYIDVP